MTRTTGNVALGGYFNDAFYLELLRTAHVLAVQAGVELTGGEVMGLGGRIRSYDAIAVPAESAELDAKANEFLAQFGLTREATISLLTNQLGVTQEELAYAWDIPTYTVMRGGERQEPQAPEFFSANPLGDFTYEGETVEGGDPSGGGAYRPNNRMMHRQGTPSPMPDAQEIYDRGGDPRRHGVTVQEPQTEYYKFQQSYGAQEDLAELYPHGYDVKNYETGWLIPNTPLEWALEATVGAMFGPSGRALMRAGGGRLFKMMADNLNVLPPELLAKFRKLSEIFDPKLRPITISDGTRWGEGGPFFDDARRTDALTETAARDQRVAEVIETDAERRARLNISDDDIDEFRRSWEEDHPGDVRRPEGGWSSEEMGGDSVRSLSRAESLVHALDSYEGMFSSPDDGTRLFQEFTEHPDRYGDTRPGWDPLADPPETFYPTERGDLPVSELTDDELAEALHSQTASDEVAERSGIDSDPESSGFQSGTELYHEVWRRFQPEDPIIDLAGAVSGGLSANAPRLDLNQITPSQLAEIPPDLLPMDVVPHPALPGRQDLLGQDGPYRFRPELEGADRYQSLSPYDLSEEALDFLSITHVDGVPRPTTAQRLAHPPDYYPPSIHPGARSSAYRPPSGSTLHSEIERIRRAEMQVAQDESWYQHQQALDPPDPQGEQVLPDTGARPGEHVDASGQPTGEWTFPEGMDRTQSMLDNWDPIEELKVWENDTGYVNIRIGDVEFTLSSHDKGVVHITWGHIGYDIAPPGSMGRAKTGIRDALRELGRIVEHLSANGVKLSASVDPGRAELVDAYRRMGFTITDPATNEAVPFMPRLSKEEVAGNSPFGAGGAWTDEQLAYAMRQANQIRYREATGNYGMFRIALDPEAAFLEAAVEGQSRMPLGLPFGGEEEWAGNAYALGKINQYSDEDIAHFYVLEAMEEYKPGEAAPFWENPPGFHPDGRPMNLQEMRNVPPNVLRDAYAKFRADRAATGFGHTGPGNQRNIPYADREIIPAPGMEDTFAAFQRTVADAAPEVQDALARFVGAAEFRPRHDVGGDIRISDIMRVKNMDGHTRDIIVVELPDGTMQPFYLRSGGGNAPGDEALLAEGGGGGAHMWVPFDGFGQYGVDRHWFRKSRFMDGIEKTDPLYRYGTAEFKDVGDKIDQYFLSVEGTLDPDSRGLAISSDPATWRPRVYNYTEVTPNDMRAGDEGFFAPAEANDLLGTVNMDDYSRMLAQHGESRGPLAEWTEGLDPADFGRPLDEVSGVYNMDNPEYRALAIRDADAGGGWNVEEAKPVGDRSDLTGIQYSQQDQVLFKNLLYEDRPDWARKYTIDEFEQMQRNGGWIDSEIARLPDHNQYGHWYADKWVPNTKWMGTLPEPFSPMTRIDPVRLGGGIIGTAYGVAGLGAMNATDFLTPLLSRETTFEEALTGTAPAIQPVQSMLAWQANNNEGWWSWIKDYPDHLEWMAKATAATMDALEKTSRSTNDQVLDGLGDGFREQAHGLATQMGGGAVPLVGREDPELLKGVGRDLSQRGHNGHQIFSNDTRKEIENGDAMIVGYRSDEDYQRAVGAAGRYGVVIDGNYWRRPSDNSLKPREGEEWTREHLQKMATSGYFGGAK